MIIGITGGIGSGKSYISKILAQYLSTSVISADEIVHTVTGVNGAAIPLIKREFGEEFINEDGSLNRKKMRDLIFKDSEKKILLESVSNPIINNAIHKKIEDTLKDYSFVVVEIPLLYESNYWKDNCDKIVVVSCKKEVQIKRVQQRNGFEITQIESIINTQATNEQRLSIANYVVDNNDCDSVELEQKIAKVALLLLVDKC